MNARPGPAEEGVGVRAKREGWGGGNISITISSSDLPLCGKKKTQTKEMQNQI